MHLWEFLSKHRWVLSPYIFGATCIVWLLLHIFKSHKRKQVPTPATAFFIGLFLASFAYVMPIYAEKQVSLWTSILYSIQHAFRLFALDGDFLEFAVYETYPEGVNTRFYIAYGAGLYALAPLLTFGFILTFFKNFIAHLKYKACWFLPTHVFSELNEKTLALANSIMENKKRWLGFIPRVLIVFTDIIDKKEELHLDLVEESKKMGAILFRKDLESVHFRRRWSFRRLYFYLISEDEAEKNRHAGHIMARYDRKNVELRLFSDNIRTELILANTNVNHITVIRVNDIQSLIYHNLDENGIHLFEKSRKIGDDNVISVVIVGLGRYGQEMLKALTWYCQLNGFKLKINAFDADKKAKKKLTAQCPELMSDQFNKSKNPVEGEAYYEINIHDGIDVSVPKFEEKLRKITDATYIFVCLGDDETNLGVSCRIRSMCERIDYEGDRRKPAIETVIYDTTIYQKLGITWEDVEKIDQENWEKPKRNKDRYKHGILMIGDLDHFYSVKTLFNSDLEKEGFIIHKFWDVEPKKLAFATEHMEQEWMDFIRKKGLTASWTDYYKDKNPKNEPSLFSAAVDKFSFMTTEESDAKKEAEEKNNKKKLIALTNTAVARADEWETMVYETFKNLLKEKSMAKKWKKKEAALITEAARGYRIDYNYRSSITKAIHARFRRKYAAELQRRIGEMEKLAVKTEQTDKEIAKMKKLVPDLLLVDLHWEKMTLEQKLTAGNIEHVRWNAYMRTEGYRYSPDRNDLAKIHHNLAPVTELSHETLRKDAAGKVEPTDKKQKRPIL